MERYTNEELATDYLRIISTRKPNIKYQQVREIIKSSQINIPAYFAEKKSLTELKVPGLGKGTIEILESILSEGAEKARAKKVREAEEEIREHQFEGTRQRETDRFAPDHGRHIQRKPLEDE